MIVDNNYRLQRLQPGQLSWGAQIQANLEALARQQGHQRQILYEGAVEAAVFPLLAFDAAGKLALASAAVDNSLARVVGYTATGTAAPPSTVTVECMGEMAGIKTEAGLVWPAAGEPGYLSAVTSGSVTDTPPSGGTTVVVVLGIFLDSPKFLYLPHLLTL